MKTRRKSIRLSAHERESLVQLYVQMSVPIDQFEERVGELTRLCSQWYRETGRSDELHEVLHYMRTQRKQGKWVRLGANATERPPSSQLTPDEMDILLQIVNENVSSKGYGSDEIAHDPEIASLIAKEFSIEAGRVLGPSDLLGHITAVRKRGLLEKVELPIEKPAEAGFADLDSSAG